MMDYQRRFGGIARLYGQAGLDRLANSHVLVIGIGGVGSWTVEALARSAIGELTLMDLDHITESNINRQLPALNSSLGRSKIEVMAERIAQINPLCQVHLVEDWLSPQNCAEWVGDQDLVIDCIDQFRSKAALIAHCQRIKKPIITVGGAGGKRDPSRIRITDLRLTEQDPLLAKTRRLLRQKYGFSRQRNLGIKAIWSAEPAIKIDQCASNLHCGGFGSSMAVTASFGLFAAAQALKQLCFDINQ